MSKGEYLSRLLDMELYKQELLDHYRFPRHKGKLIRPDVSSGLHNPSCGDHVCIEAKISDGHIVEIAFDGGGCVISQATASLLAEFVLGKPIEFIQNMQGQDMLVLINMELGPTRLKCALLSLHALQSGILIFLQKT